MPLFPLLASLVVPSASACPTIATGTTAQLSFDIAQVAIVREGTRTTFSVSINPLGERQGFALVLPVPQILEESAIRTLDPSLFAALDGFTAPRHVSDAGCGGGGGDSDTDTDVDTDADADTTDGAVDVEAEYLVGEYAITILSATESTALGTWLDTHGYYLPDGAEPRLAEYIDAGSYFLAAKVAEDATVADGTPLSPLQIAYDSDVFAIPLRLATLNSPGEQDMVIYAVTDRAQGGVAISNYPEFEVPDRCVWGDPNTDDFASFYQDLYEEEWAAQGDAAWTVEFAGGMWDCSPCTNTWVYGDQLRELGFTADEKDYYITRLHMRYTPEQADQDLTLYASGIRTTKTTSYADDFAWNHTCIDTYCDGTPTPEPGDTGDTDGTDPTTDGPGTGCGCVTGAGPGFFGGFVGVMLGTIALGRRRR